MGFRNKKSKIPWHKRFLLRLKKKIAYYLDQIRNPDLETIVGTSIGASAGRIIGYSIVLVSGIYFQSILTVLAMSFMVLFEFWLINNMALFFLYTMKMQLAQNQTVFS